MAMRRGPRNVWSIPHVAPATREPADECVEDGCERPAYIDGRCKRCRDVHEYVTGRLGGPLLHPDVIR